MVSRHHEIQLYAPDASVDTSHNSDHAEEEDQIDTEKGTRYTRQARDMAVIENFTDNKLEYAGHQNGGIKSVPKHRKRTVSDLNQTKLINSALDNIDTIRLVENPAPSNVKIQQLSESRTRQNFPLRNLRSSLNRQTENGSALESKLEPEIKASHELISPSQVHQ